jgi:hypothetical protein
MDKAIKRESRDTEVREDVAKKMATCLTPSRVY